jgi:type VI secretion system protein ImpC
MGGRLDFDFRFGGGKTGARRREDGGPFRLLLVADFSGRAWRREGGDRPALRKPVPVDAEALDRAFAACGVSIPLAGRHGTDALALQGVDDLHPDRLLARTPELAEPLQLRRDLARGAPGADTFAAAERWLAAQVELAAASGTALAATPMVSSTALPGSAPPPTESTDATLERLLGRSGSPASAAAAHVTDVATGAAGAINSLIESIIRPHVTSDPGPRRAQLLMAVDEVLTMRLRDLLATPAFRAVEGAWRGAERLVRTVDTDSDLRVALLDACREDLIEAVGGEGGGVPLESSPLHRLLVEDEPRFSLVAADMTFDLARADLQLCASLGALVSRGGGAFLAGAGPSLLGCDTLAQVADPAAWRALDGAPGAASWQALRGSRIAGAIGLCLPRVLGRLPYGKKTDPIDAFPFEELGPSAGRAPERRVWTGAAFALAEAYGAAFRADGWTMEPGAHLDLDDLPAHTYDDDGEMRLVPPAEVPLGERAGAAIVAAGLTAILARRDRGAARVLDAGSIATPGRPLDGPWSGAEAG